MPLPRRQGGVRRRGKRRSVSQETCLERVDRYLPQKEACPALSYPDSPGSPLSPESGLFCSPSGRWMPERGNIPRKKRYSAIPSEVGQRGGRAARPSLRGLPGPSRQPSGNIWRPWTLCAAVWDAHPCGRSFLLICGWSWPSPSAPCAARSCAWAGFLRLSRRCGSSGGA